MPVGSRKNRWYAIALPVFGKRCHWRQAALTGTPDHDQSQYIARILRRHRTVGGCVQIIRNGKLAETYSVGFATLSPQDAVMPDTVFRTASIAKLVCALLVMRLQTLGRLRVEEDISDFWGQPIRNPHHPEQPIPLGSLLSHTSGMVDTAAYFRSFHQNTKVSDLLTDPALFTDRKPYERFQYSNFAAGLIGCLLERRFGQSLETLMQTELFEPLAADATFDLSTLGGRRVASSYRVLPPGRLPAFDAAVRFRAASPLDQPNPECHYLLASGNLYLTAQALGRLCLPLINGGLVDGKPFLSPKAFAAMTAPLTAWPEPEVRIRHGMGLLEVDDPRIHAHRLLGHQGFAYGAVNGVFWDDRGYGFVSLNAGASEQRVGHLSCLNRDLIRLCIPEEPHE